MSFKPCPDFMLTDYAGDTFTAHVNPSGDMLFFTNTIGETGDNIAVDITKAKLDELIDWLQQLRKGPR